MSRSVALLPWLALLGCPQASTTSPTDDGATDVAATDTGATGDTSPSAEQLCQVTVACGGNILADPKTPCDLRVVDADGATLYDGPAGFELRGRSSLTFDKPQYALELRTWSELPLWPGSSWSHTNDFERGWETPRHDDSQWPADPAPLGYGGDNLSSVIPVQSGEGRTTYFRRTFTPAGLDEISNLDFGLDRHDGAVVWLNGTEVLRANLASDATRETPALSAAPPTDGTRWTFAELDPALLVAGDNVLAIEIHSAAGATALRFDAFLEASGDDAPTDLFAMGSEDDWILNGQYVDRSLYRDRLAFDTFQSFGGRERYATRTVFCELELDGRYQGLYTLGEKLERGPDRLDLDTSGAPGESFHVKLDDVDGFHANAVGYGTWQLEYPDPDPEAIAAVTQFLEGWEDAILGPDPADPATGIFAWLDLSSAVDWVLLNELLKNHDAYFLSVHLWKDADAKMRFAPWDHDLSMGYPYTDCGAEGWVSRTWAGADGVVHPIPFIREMAEIPEFREALVTRWTELRADQLSEEVLFARIDGYEATLAPALDANFERWPMEDITFSTDGVPDWLCPVATWQDEQVRTRAFLAERLTWIDAHLADF